MTPELQLRIERRINFLEQTIEETANDLRNPNTKWNESIWLINTVADLLKPIKDLKKVIKTELNNHEPQTNKTTNQVS